MSIMRKRTKEPIKVEVVKSEICKRFDILKELNVFLEEIERFIERYESVNYKLQKLEDNTQIEIKEMRNALKLVNKELLNIKLKGEY